MTIRKQELDNGLVVASETMPHLRSVAIGVWVRSGSRFENPSLCGISHFIEHLLFKGTESRSAEEIAKAIDSVGGQLDAFTDKEYVGFFARVLDEHLPLAFELLADIVLNPSFPARELEQERKVIFEEISTVEDSPQDLVHDLFLESFWRGHPLGRPILGTRESVGRISRRDVAEYFARCYRAAGNIVIAVAGNIRHRQVQELVKRYFGDLPRGAGADPGAAPVPHFERTLRHKPNLEQTHLCIGVTAPARISEDRFCAHLLNNILGGGVSSRLFQNIREKRGLVYAIDSMLNQYHDAGSLVVCAATGPRTAAQVSRLVLKEFRNLRDELVSEEELQRAKDCLKGSLTLSLESSSSRMSYLAQQQVDFDRSFCVSEVLSQIDRVKRADVRKLARRLFDSPANLVALGKNDGRQLDNVTLRI